MPIGEDTYGSGSGGGINRKRKEEIIERVEKKEESMGMREMPLGSRALS